MKFTVFLIAALAVAAASESESFGSGVAPKEDALHKLTKWLSFNLPFLAPIRTTPRPRPAATTRAPATTVKATTKRPAPTTKAPQTTTTTTPAPAPAPAEPAPAEQPPSNEQQQPPMDPMEALNQLYQMEGLKDLLPPMSEIMNPDPNQPDLMSKPVGEIADEFTMNLMKSILAYIQSKPPGSVNLDDPIDLTSDGSSL